MKDIFKGVLALVWLLIIGPLVAWGLYIWLRDIEYVWPSLIVPIVVYFVVLFLLVRLAEKK